MRRSRVVQVVAGVTIVGLSTGSAAPSAVANDQTMLSYPNYPDNYNHGVYTGNTWGEAATTGLNEGVYQLNRTTLSVYHETPWNDVYAGQNELDPVAGRFGCLQQAANGRCDKSYAFVDDDISQTSEPTYWKALFCHEIGHSGALAHRSNGDGSCMRTPAVSASTALAESDIFQSQFYYASNM